MTDSGDEIGATLALAATARRGTQHWIDAITHFGSAQALLDAGDRGLRTAGFPSRVVAALPRAAAHARARGVLEACSARGIRIAVYTSGEYPAMLRPLRDPPLALFWRGAVAPAAVAPAAAIVGARRATRYGLRCARRFGASVAGAGAWVISGLAHGIDAAAQTAAVKHGRTAAVLAGGIDRCYPAANRALAERVLETGVVLSEYPPGTPTLPRHFPVRNRIITGMATVTVVVEAHLRSGSLVSARHAADQGRDVLAVPGPIDSPASIGTNRLLADGCGPALGPEEILAALGVAPPPAAPVGSTIGAEERPGPRDVSETAVFHALDFEPGSLDDLVAATGLDESVILEKLTTLELDGLVERLPGGAYVRCTRTSDATEHS